CCWTLGRVYCLPLTPAGASYRTESEVFLETTGEVGFAPVDLAVGKTGDLFIAIGGRRTRGSVFRVRYVGKKPPEPSAKNELPAVLQAPQPLASWSRTDWRPRALKLGRQAFSNALLDDQLA